MTLLTHWEGEPVAVWASLWGVPRLDVHDVTGSTNDDVRRMAEAGARPYSMVIAEEQTAGRGRSGAPWLSAAGAGLLCSTLLPGGRTPLPLHLPLVVGVAAARAMEAAAPGLHAGIKWPNDILVDGRKVCGVLCEAGPAGAVAGVGINVRPFEDGTLPTELRGRVASLEEAAGHRVARAVLAGRFVAHLRDLLADEDHLGWTAEVRAELARRDVLAGRAVETHVGRGTARGIGPDGALMVETPDGGSRGVVAGSVRVV